MPKESSLSQKRLALGGLKEPTAILVGMNGINPSRRWSGISVRAICGVPTDQLFAG